MMKMTDEEKLAMFSLVEKARKPAYFDPPRGQTIREIFRPDADYKWWEFQHILWWEFQHILAYVLLFSVATDPEEVEHITIDGIYQRLGRLPEPKDNIQAIFYRPIKFQMSTDMWGREYGTITCEVGLGNKVEN